MDKKGEFPDILPIHPIYNFRDFDQIAHSDNDYFREKWKKLYIGWIRWNQAIYPSCNFCDFPSKMKICEIS